MPVIILCMCMYYVLPFTSVLWLTSPFLIKKLPLSCYPNDTKKAEMRIVQAPAQGVMISLNSLECAFTL